MPPRKKGALHKKFKSWRFLYAAPRPVGASEALPYAFDLTLGAHLTPKQGYPVVHVGPAAIAACIKVGDYIDAVAYTWREYGAHGQHVDAEERAVTQRLGECHQPVVLVHVVADRDVTIEAEAATKHQLEKRRNALRNVASTRPAKPDDMDQATYEAQLVQWAADSLRAWDTRHPVPSGPAAVAGGNAVGAPLVDDAHDGLDYDDAQDVNDSVDLEDASDINIDLTPRDNAVPVAPIVPSGIEPQRHDNEDDDGRDHQRQRVNPSAGPRRCIFQHITVFIRTSEEMLNFLEALPTEWLSEPMAVLRQLFRAKDARRLAGVPLWPTLELPRGIISDPEILGWIDGASAMYPMVSIDDYNAPPPPVHPVPSMAALQYITPALGRSSRKTAWRQRFEPQDGMAAALRALPALREVQFISNSRYTTFDLLSVVQVLASTPLTLVCFVRAEWSEAMVTTMVAWLGTGSLKTLVLLSIVTTNALATTLSKAIAASATLREIDISYGSLALRFFKDVQALPPQLVSVELDGFSRDDLPAIASVITNSRLRHISLRYGATESPDAYFDKTLELIQALGRLRSLRSCHLSHLKLSPVCALAFSTLMPRLTSAEFTANGLDDNAVLALAAVLPHCQHLECIRFNAQELGDGGAKCLAVVVPLCPSLRELNLRENRIGSVGAER
ncbi:hypothetical protein SDRG_11233 [Saprolegnia diclina VS20]|uniref:Uncharacterized protein n=1 Tax=Saprolegnia diclina (strain VS20) TaxID=1156394 RepID=T0Q8T0_SAPDV|nr:hypothetical protein SDRG_11233 [Saprolegnia diclina VS20]EQC31046.1 hypothetical protein SDRG_11233 [Saprolegnia diclina VS20]|eukprot:XP_008615485.1 hypothetical protein SDRG_11233 [Saprolegnia diclina VS20]